MGWNIASSPDPSTYMLEHELYAENCLSSRLQPPGPAIREIQAKHEARIGPELFNTGGARCRKRIVGRGESDLSNPVSSYSVGWSSVLDRRIRWFSWVGQLKKPPGVMYLYLHIKPLIDFSSNEKSDCPETVVSDLLLLDEFFIIVIIQNVGARPVHSTTRRANGPVEWKCRVSEQLFIKYIDVPNYWYHSWRLERY